MTYCFRKKTMGLFWVVLFTSFLTSQSNTPVIEGVAAIVGDNIILKSDLSQMVAMTAANQRFNPIEFPERTQKLQEEILQSLIEQKIILEMAELDSVIVDDKDVDKALTRQVDNFIAQSGSEEKAEEALGQSLKSFRREYWFDMRDKMITEQYQYSLLSSISVSRNEIYDFFETYRDSLPLFPTLIKLNHLLLPIQPGEISKNIAYHLLDSLHTELLSGADFSTVAKQFSQDPGSANRGGDLGFVRRGTLVPVFESTAFNLKNGELSEIVETEFGYHLIENLEKQGEKIHVRHILISPEITTADKSRAWAFASSLKDSIQSLEDFERFTARYSTDESTKNTGGNLGWVDPSTYPIKEISEVIYQLSPHECSPPIQTSYGYHLLWLGDIRKGGKPNLETHWPEIEEMALNRKKMLWFEDWMGKSKKLFYIKIASE